jgi:hypothetical protein
MAFYHGTSLIIDTIDLTMSRLRTDFGKGIYFTDKIGTAQNWAASKATLRGTPTILSYEISDNLYHLYGKRFDGVSAQWLEFICFNRQRTPPNSLNSEPRHDYNWVSGQIANDDIADVVDDYLSGDITAEEAIQRARALPQTYQLSLHTKDAIRFVDDVNVSYRQFKNGRWSRDWIKR